MAERRSPKPDVRGSSPLAPVLMSNMKEVEFARFLASLDLFCYTESLVILGSNHHVFMPVFSWLHLLWRRLDAERDILTSQWLHVIDGGDDDLVWW